MRFLVVVNRTTTDTRSSRFIRSTWWLRSFRQSPSPRRPCPVRFALAKRGVCCVHTASANSSLISSERRDRIEGEYSAPLAAKDMSGGNIGQFQNANREDLGMELKSVFSFRAHSMRLGGGFKDVHETRDVFKGDTLAQGHAYDVGFTPINHYTRRN